MSPGLLLALSVASSIAGSGPVSSVVAPPAAGTVTAPPSASPPPSSVVAPSKVAPPPSASPPSSVVTPPTAVPPSSVVTPPTAVPPGAVPPSSVVTPPAPTPPSATPPADLAAPQAPSGPPSGGAPGGLATPPTPPTPPSGVPTPSLPPGGAPPAGVVAPPGGTPPTPPGGVPLDPSGVVDGASEALSKAGEIKSRVDAVREELGSLAQREPPSDEGGTDDDAGAKTAAPQQEPASEPAEGYIDYSTTWHDPPRSHIVVTQVVHRPVRVPPPAPPPDLSYEPRAHGFVGLSLRGTSTTNHNPSVLTGGRLGFVFDDRFTIGGAFYSLTARFGGPITDPVGNKLGMRMAYGGVLLGWTLYKGRVVQLGLETLAGAGAACVSKNRRSYGKWECLEKVGLVSIEPGLSLGFVVTDWVRMGLTGGYRFVTREAWRTPNEFTLSGPYVGLDIDFGAFRTNGDR